MIKKNINFGKNILVSVIVGFVLFSCKDNPLKNEVVCIFLEDNKAERVYKDSIKFIRDIQIDSFYLVPPYYPLSDLGDMFNCKFICNSSYVPSDYFMLFKPGKENSKALLINVISNNFGGYSLKDSSEIFNRLFIKDGNLFRKKI